MIKRNVIAIIIMALTSCRHSKFTIDDKVFSENVRTCQGEPVRMHYQKGRIISAKFPGGDDAFEQFIQANEKHQILSDTTVIHYDLTIEIFVDKFGKVNKDTIVVGDEYKKWCTGCPTEAKRLVRLMPDWEPAYTIEKGKKIFTANRESIDITF